MSTATYSALTIMWKGMAAVFVVMAVLLIAIKIINKIKEQ